MRRTYKTWLIHSLAYYIAWIACVFSATQQQAFLGPFLAIGLIGVQILWQHYQHQPWKKALYFAAILMLIGTLLDTLFLHCGLIQFNANPFSPYVSPLWMMCIWLSFGLNLIFLTERFLSHYLIIGLLTSILMPLAYWIGIKLGAAEIVSTDLFYVILGISWGLFLPVCCYFYLNVMHRSPSSTFIPN